MRLLAGRSIAVRLAASSVFWSLLILLIAGLILSALYKQATERSFDERLLVYANDLAAGLVTPGDTAGREIGLLGDPRFDIPLSGWYWQIGRIDARPRDIRSSRSLLGNPLPTLAPASLTRPFGQIRKNYVVGPEAVSLRLLERDIDLGEDGRFVVRLAGPTEEIADARARFDGSLILTFGLLGAALAVSTLFQIRFGLKPFLELRRAVGDVRQGTQTRIDGLYPSDVAPLADELNLLLDANRDILERARTQVGNLAHALKTPLSVMTNDADAAPGELAERVREQAAIMRDQVDYYLNRARAAALAGTLGAVTEVAPVLGGLVRTFEKIYQARDLAITLRLSGSPLFKGERQDLEEMAGNLIDNACKWATSRVDVHAEVGAVGERPTLHIFIDDDGPGLPQGAWADVVQRGRRLDETVPGSGLGLSIASDLAREYRGRIEFGVSPLGGARAELQLAGEEGKSAT